MGRVNLCGDVSRPPAESGSPMIDALAVLIPTGLAGVAMVPPSPRTREVDLGSPVDPELRRLHEHLMKVMEEMRAMRGAARMAFAAA